MNENLKMDDQKFLYKKCTSERINMAYYENNKFKINMFQKIFIFFLQENQNFDNLDYLYEIKTLSSKFEKQYQNYKDKKYGKNKEFVEIIEKIVTNFLSNLNANEKMYLNFFKLVSQERLKNRVKLKEENNHLLNYIKNEQ